MWHTKSFLLLIISYKRGFAVFSSETIQPPLRGSICSRCEKKVVLTLREVLMKKKVIIISLPIIAIAAVVNSQ